MQYKIFKETLWHEDIGSYESYGIRYENTFSISDVSLEFESLKKFVNQLNSNHTQLRFVYGLIEQYLSEN